MMRWMANLRVWLRSVRRRDDLEDGLNEEIRFHLDRLTERNVRSGMGPDDARRQARIEFGGIESVREQTRDQFRPVFVEDLLRDVRYAGRALRRAPAFTVTAALTLALGLGATTAVFSVVSGVLIKPLPYPDADALVAISHTAPAARINEMPTAATQFLTYRDHNKTLAAIGLWSVGDGTVTGLAEPQQIEVLRTTHGTLQALGVPPAVGRWFSREEDYLEAAPVVILTHGYWQRTYGRDPSVIGRTLTLDSVPRTIVGVMPADFRFLSESPDAIVPFGLDRTRLLLGAFNFSAIARLEQGVTIEQARADLARIVPVWLEAWPSPPGFQKDAFSNSGLLPVLRPLQHSVVGDIGNVLWILLGTIGIVLLIACANVANLLLVRAEARQQELAVRSALGAGAMRLARELMVESLLLGLIGGAAGLALAYVGLDVLLAFGPTTLPRLHEITIDPSVVGVALILSGVSGVLFGMIPVLKHASPNSGRALRGTARTSTDTPDRHRTRSALVVMQVALASVLLVASGLMMRTFVTLRAVDPGFSRSAPIQLVRLSIPESLIADPHHVLRAQMDIRERLGAIPGVSTASFASAAPMEPYVSADGVFTEGTREHESARKIRRFKFVAPGFFRTVGVRIVTGRDFTWADVHQRGSVAVVSENLAREIWRDPAAAIGKRIRESPAGPWRSIVGVVGSVHDNGVHVPAPTTVYWPPLLENFWGDDVVVRRSMTFVIHSERAGTESLLDDVRRAVWAVNGSVPVAEVQTLAAVYERSMARTSFMMVMLLIAGTMALLLGVIGIYGVVAYTVTQRRREIGIRVALGAARGQLERMFVGQGVRLALLGVICGSIAAVSAVRVLASLLFGTNPVDPATYCFVGLGLITAAALASYLPAHRAASVDPMVALRTE